MQHINVVKQGVIHILYLGCIVNTLLLQSQNTNSLKTQYKSGVYISLDSVREKHIKNKNVLTLFYHCMTIVL